MSKNNYLPLMRCAHLRGFNELVLNLGGEPDALLQDTGLGNIILEQEDQLLPCHSVYNALEYAAQTLNCPDFGLRLSEHQDADTYGALATLVLNSNSLWQAMQTLASNYHLHNQAAQPQLRVDNEFIIIELKQSVPKITNYKQATLLAYGNIARFAQQVFVPQFIAKAYYLRYSETGDTKRFQTVFKAPTYFNQDFNGAVVKITDMQRPITINPIAIKNIDQFVQHISPKKYNKVSLTQQLRLMISNNISQGKTSLKHHAELLQISDRTLQRRLKKEGVTFQQLLDEERKQLASSLLHSGKHNMAQISERLGFSDASIFTRSFKKWYNLTPREYNNKI